MDNAKIAGSNNFEVGRSLGKYWGDFFGERWFRKKHECLYEEYKEWLLADKLATDRLFLMNNVALNFPELMSEIIGMVAGINESSLGYIATLPGLFGCCLAESDYSTHKQLCSACSTYVLRTKEGYSMAHSEEYDKPYPLLMAEVTLGVGDAQKNFCSISHPFQFLGSAGGKNCSIAFQGNSIGCDEKTFNLLFKSRNKRIPKTIFTRMMLETHDVSKIMDLYQRYPSTLPNQHIILSSDNAYRLEVRPTEESARLISIDCEKYVQTNHFSGDCDANWTYEDPQESIDRMNFLMAKTVKTDSELPVAFREFLDEYPVNKRKKRLREKTSGVFIFKTRINQKPTCEADFFFGKGSGSKSR